MYEELVKRLREHNGWALNETLDEAADAIEELLRAAKKMHLWIFLNTGDEQKAYDWCGLSDEMNAALGYSGRFELRAEPLVCRKPGGSCRKCWLDWLKQGVDNG